MKFAGSVEETITKIASAEGTAVDTAFTASTSSAEAVTAGGRQLPCRLVDPELFFAESPADVEYAKALCRDCPVRDLCLSGAMDRREPWGVWGGQLFIQGVVVARKRPRGRPRKHPLPEPVIDPRVAPAARQAGSVRPERKEEAA